MPINQKELLRWQSEALRSDGLRIGSANERIRRDYMSVVMPDISFVL